MSVDLLQPVQRVYSDFSNFAWKNNILASTVGFTIGMATKELIENMSTHAGVPSITQLYTMITNKQLSSGAAVPATWSGSLLLIALDLLKWAGILLMTFLVATYIMNWLLDSAKTAAASGAKYVSGAATSKDQKQSPQM